MHRDYHLYKKILLLLEKRSYWLIIINILVIVFFTLLPFNFTIPNAFSQDYVLTQFKHKIHLTDSLLNIAFFMPFGFSAVIVLYRHRCSIFINLISTLILGFCLSLSVELGQIFLVSREPSLVDLVTNTIGSIFGAALFFWFKNNYPLISAFWHRLSFLHDRLWVLKIIGIIWLSYLCFMSFWLINIEGATKLYTWNNDYFLTIGNEVTSDRPWSGKISYLSLSDSSLSRKKIKRAFNSHSFRMSDQPADSRLLAAYEFLESERYYPNLAANAPLLQTQGTIRLPLDMSTNADQLASSAKNNPNVQAWQPTPEGITINPIAMLGQKNWLKSEFPAVKINNRIKHSSQFSLVTKIATLGLEQEGPARIVSLSQGHLFRNLTVAQWHHDLRIRIRTPFTGENGKEPEIRLANFFTDNKYHQLAITYDGLYLKIYRDQVETLKSLYLGSETTLFWSLLSLFSEKMYLNVGIDYLYKLLYYSVIFLPLGILFGLISNFLDQNSADYFTILGSGLIAPPLIIEGFIVVSSNRLWSWQNMSLGLLFSVFGWALTIIVSKQINVDLNSSN